MIKKIFTSTLLALALFIVAQAQSVGTWKIHSTFVGSEVTNVVDAGDKVYYLVSGNLFSYDKETQENQSYDKGNYLSDVIVSQLYYNYDKKYIVVTYNNSNIDVIQQSGKVINIPDIKDALLTTTKTINDITFAPGEMYVATAFGYVVINDSKFEVKESHIYNTDVNSMAKVGNWLVFSARNNLYYGKATDRHDYIGTFKSRAFDNCKIYPVSSNKAIFATGYTYVGTLTEAAGDMQLDLAEQAQHSPATMQRTPNGFVLNYTEANYKKYITLDANGENRQIADNNGELYSTSEASGWWAVGASGLHHIVNGTEVTGYIKPSGINFAMPLWMTFNTAQNKLYVSSSGASVIYPRHDNYQTFVNTLEGDTWTDVTPPSGLYGTTKIIFDPTDPNTYYTSSWMNGIYKVTGNNEVFRYNEANSPFKKDYICNVYPAFDAHGNLWGIETQFQTTGHHVAVLPRAKVGQTNVTAADWIEVSDKLPNVTATKRSSFIITKNDIKVSNAGDYGNPVCIWDDGGDPTGNFKVRTFSSLTDQDNKDYTWLYVRTMVEDQNGIVWMGSDNGIISFDPSAAFSDNFTINHIKVPRNDGTNLADYLLDGISVNCIAVDGSNRKWIGTNGSGLFLVSPDGSEIINQFTTDNSYLPSNVVYNVCCNPTSNSVYIITPSGFLEYFSDAMPAAADYSDVYAYPNPVRPDYTGYITIKNLMDNSTIKIADAAGNVITTIKSNGGMATWDGCNASGRPVKTGVYFVFASQSDPDASSDAAVTKIMIIR